MNPGKLDTRCTFQEQTRTSDGGGGFTTEWTDRFTAWGGFMFPSIRSRMEVIAAGAVQTVNAAQLTVRDSTNTRLVTKEWRVEVVSDPNVSPTAVEVWNVRKALPRTRDGYLRFEVEEGVPT